MPIKQRDSEYYIRHMYWMDTISEGQYGNKLDLSTDWTM